MTRGIWLGIAAILFAGSTSLTMAQSAPVRGEEPLPATGPSDMQDIAVMVQAGEETTLSSQMAGKIRKVHIGLGENVTAGAKLIEFDCSEQEAQLQAAEADYRGARETHLTKLRLQALGAAGELEVTVAAAVADKARSQMTLRESQLAYCAVNAPFSGKVAKLRVRTAESVQSGQPLVDLVLLTSLKAQIFVPASWAIWLRPGMPFQVRIVDAGRSYKARVAKINARIEGVSQQLEIEGRFDEGSAGLLPGMVGTAIFPNRPKR